MEQEAVCLLAAKFQEDNKSFKIITPYDAQRSAIEELLKQKELVWEDKCFNIDSFQGTFATSPLLYSH
jgi:superfamily I DNA and/or RNA helicase